LARERRCIDHRDVATVRIEVFQTAYDIAGGGAFGSKDSPATKEQANYNLKYLLAAALIDGEVGPEQLQTERIRRPDVQELLTRIHIRPDAALTARYPHGTPVRVELTSRGSAPSRSFIGLHSNTPTTTSAQRSSTSSTISTTFRCPL
jgi:2-methylcitrate dehydratase PrpD